MNQMNIPASDPNDSDDVALALETAEALWNKGDPNEALRWLRRAAEAAGDSGNDTRAVVLAKAVAELNAIGSDQNAPKQVRPPPLPPQAPQADTGKVDTLGSGLQKGGLKGVSKAPPPPPSPPSVKKSTPSKPPSPPSSARASKAPLQKEPAFEQEAEPTAAQPKTLNPPPTPPGKSANSQEANDEVVTSVKSSVEQTDFTEGALRREETSAKTKEPAPGREPSPASRSSSAKSPSSKSKPTVQTKASAPVPSDRKRNFAHAALRVYVTTKEQQGDRLEVHVLNAGQRPPAGAIEAMLVPLRRGTKLIR